MAWRLESGALPEPLAQAKVDGRLAFYAFEEPSDHAELFIVVRARVRGPEVARVDLKREPPIQVMAECPAYRGNPNANAYRLLAALHRYAFSRLNGWRPDDPDADTHFGKAMDDATVALPLKLTADPTDASLDASDDRRYSTAEYRPMLGPVPA